MRHLSLLISWCVVFATTIAGVLMAPALMTLVFLVAPILALATLSSVKRDEAVLAHRWLWPYRILIGMLVLAGAGGVVAVAPQVPSHWLGNAPLAALFLIAVIYGWRALVAPTPKRAAMPGAILLASWIPLLIANLFTYYRDDEIVYGDLLFVCGVGVLALGAIGNALATVAFVDLPTVDFPDAIARRK
jgi:hypothetical protein